jgi:RNA polymerase sigma factor (sigma-70 family)
MSHDPAAARDIRGYPNAFGDSTVRLLERIQRGDGDALEVLFARYATRLRRWASGRLPYWARDISDTHDLVQQVLLDVMKRLGSLEVRGELAFQAYVRQALRNRIAEEHRVFSRRPSIVPMDPGHADSGVSPLEAAIGSEAAERYERALATLRAEDRQLIVARVEMACSYEEIAAAGGKPSADAARKGCARALVRLADAMKC